MENVALSLTEMMGNVGKMEKMEKMLKNGPSSLGSKSGAESVY